jgi:hypothetical protein
MEITYDDLWAMWMRAKEQQIPSMFAPVQNYPNAPQNYFMKPEDMVTLVRDLTPYDLYNKPDNRPIPLDYPTSAFNISNLPNDLGIQEAIFQASRNPQNSLMGLIGTPMNAFMNIPINKQQEAMPYFPQGVYQHEVGHYLNPQLLQYLNRGFLTKYGIPQGTPIMAREAPAMAQENRFWRGY